jgi:hypothetical protein
MALDYKLRSLIKLNLKFFLDMHFLRDGAYYNVPSGALFYDGNDMSLLIPDTEAPSLLYGVTTGQVWQSPFRQWVYESGVVQDGINITAPPILASGVYIQGAFRHSSDPVYGHKIDYLNGRVVFNNPIPLTEKINAQFSARDVRIDFEHSFNQQFNTGFLESKYFTNPYTSQSIVYPSGNFQPFPAIFIEVADREFEPYEMGNRSAIIKETVNCHIWALDDMQRDNIVDTLTAQWHKRVPMIDWNFAPLPLSGIYNTLSDQYVPYQKMLKNDVITTSRGSYRPIRFIADIDEIRAFNLPPVEQALEYERSLVTMKLNIYLNNSTQTLGDASGPISSLPTLEENTF